MNARAYHVIYFGMKMYISMYCMIWLVCKMDVCMYQMICFGVRNECLHVAYLFAVLSQTIGNNCPGIEANLNCQKWNWKWALALTLPNTIAQKTLPSPLHPTLSLLILVQALSCVGPSIYIIWSFYPLLPSTWWATQCMKGRFMGHSAFAELLIIPYHKMCFLSVWLSHFFLLFHFF